MKWFTSDWHLGHRNIAGPTVSKWPDGYRNFRSVQEMDEVIINTMNEFVKPGDLVYYAGDFTLGEPDQWNHYLDRLNFNFHEYVVGNHDKGTPYKVFMRAQQIVETKIGDTKVVICHYPMRSWNKSHHGSIHLYGHEHGMLEEEGPWGRSMDIGIDNAYKLFGKWRPFSEEDVMEIMEKRERKLFGHHTGIR